MNYISELCAVIYSVFSFYFLNTNKKEKYNKIATYIIIGILYGVVNLVCKRTEIEPTFIFIIISFIMQKFLYKAYYSRAIIFSLIFSGIYAISCVAVNIIMPITAAQEHTYLFSTALMILTAFAVKIHEKAQNIDKYKEQAERFSEFHKFRHDYKNQLAGLQMLLENGNIPKAQEYLQKLTEKLHKASVIETYSDNSFINAIMQDFAHKCAENNIQFTSSLLVGNELSLSEHDLCTIFMNLCDNAFEAAKKVKYNRFITFSTSRRQNWLIISAENSYNKKIKTDKQGELISSKKDYYLHGIGLSNIKSAIKQVSGAKIQIDRNTSEGIFSISLIFPR